MTKLKLVRVIQVITVSLIIVVAVSLYNAYNPFIPADIAEFLKNAIGIMIGLWVVLLLVSTSELLSFVLSNLKEISSEFWQIERNVTSLSRMKLPDGKRSLLRSCFASINTMLLSLVFLIMAVLSALFTILPSTLALAIVTLVGLTAVIFSWLFLRRTFFGSIYLKTEDSKVNWQKYGEIKTLNVFGMVWGVLVVLAFLVNVVVKPQSTSFLRDFSTLALFFVVLYTLILWRRTSLSQNLDEYHSKLAGLIVENTPESNQLKLPTRCHIGDSHNICLRITPAHDHKSDGWEAELQAAGVKICGKLPQQSPVASREAELLFFWNCYFENAGTYLVNVLLRTTTDQGSVKQEVLRKSHEIKVITLYRQYATTLVTAIVAVLTFLLTLMSSMQLDMASVLQSLHF